MTNETTCGSHENSLTQQPMDRTITTRDDLVDEVERRGAVIEQLRADKDVQRSQQRNTSYEASIAELEAEIARLTCERDEARAAAAIHLEQETEWRDSAGRLTAALNRYRYVHHWWASDSYDSGREFRARMSWARGEDIHQELSNDEIAKIGQQFLAATDRRPDLRGRGDRGGD